jgi:acetyl-CoA carboxylase carboxyltransferase component
MGRAAAARKAAFPLRGNGAGFVFAPRMSSHRQANAPLREELERLRSEHRVASPKAVERQHAKSKLTIPERLDLLFDAGSPRLEIGEFAGHGMYANGGGVLSGGVRAVVGRVSWSSPTTPR